jgi:hypothetical protein
MFFFPCTGLTAFSGEISSKNAHYTLAPHDARLPNSESVGLR